MFNSFNCESDWLQYQLTYKLLYNWLNKVCHTCFVLTRCITILILWTNQNNHLTNSMWPTKEIPWTSHDWHQNCILLAKYLEQFFQSLWRRANGRNVSFFTLYGGQFKFWKPKQFHFENQNEKAVLFSFYSPSVATIRRIFNLFTNSHKSPAITNTSNKADDKIRAAWNIEPSISNNPVVLSTASGIEDSWRKQLITFNQNDQ